MRTDSPTKINQLLRSQPVGVVLASAWLVKQGYSLDLLRKYRESGWLESIGTGALIRAGDDVGYEGAVYALQRQLGLSVHPGGITALELLGRAHYLAAKRERIILFGQTGEILPAWFRNREWDARPDYYTSSFLPAGIGMTEAKLGTFTLSVSSAARAMMECLYLVPDREELSACYELMEGLNNLVPATVRKLLEACGSVKVKRLFLYLAEKAGHDWFNRLDLEGIDLGTGKRSLVSGGVYIPRYQITVPRELEKEW